MDIADASNRVDVNGSLSNGMANSPKSVYMAKETTITDPNVFNKFVSSNMKGETTIIPKKTVLDMFHLQVKLVPQNVAVVEGSNKITYEVLNQRASNVAWELSKHLFEDNQFIVVLQPQGIDYITTILAILKTGRAYVPLSFDYPLKRIKLILENLENPLLVVNDTFRRTQQGRELLYARIYNIAQIKDIELKRPDNLKVPERSGNDLVYMIYTSGTTGVPKGILVKHESLTNFTLWAINYYDITSADRSMLFATPTFDATGIETWPFLSSGACISAVPPTTRYDIQALRDWMNKDSITFVMMTTRQGEQFFLEPPESFSSALRYISVGGEKLVQSIPQSMPFQVVNLYGPAEATICCTATRVTPSDSLSEGLPIFNTEIWILDENLVPVSVGQTGEVYIGGVGVAQGYFKRSELNEEHFIKNPFSTNWPILYKSGDLGRCLESGELEILGRIGNQLKIRGYRIEPEEIEAIMTTHPHIGQAFALLHENELRAYFTVIPNKQLTNDELFVWLKDRLPSYAVPTQLLELQHVPFTSNGKLDRVALSNQNIESKSKFSPPTTESEHIIANMWAELLQIPVSSICVNKSFFELGGNSLNAGRFINEMNAEPFRLNVSIQNIFNRCTIAIFGKMLDTNLSNFTENRIKLGRRRKSPGEMIPLSYAQEQIWLHLLEQIKGVDPYKEYYAVMIPKSLNLHAIDKTINFVVKRHETLRSLVIFDPKTNSPVQFVQEDQAPSVEHLDASGVPTNELELDLIKFFHAPLELHKGPLIRFLIVKFDDTKFEIHVVFHHIIMDGAGTNLLESELRQTYNWFLTNDSPPLLQPLEVQYADFAECQRRSFDGDDDDDNESLLIQKHLQNLKSFDFPTDYPRQKDQSGPANSYSLTLSSQLSHSIKAFSSKWGTSIFITLLASTKALLYRLTGQADIFLTVPMRISSNALFDRVIGHYVNTVIVRSRLEEDDTFLSFLQQVHSSHGHACSHSSHPFQKVVRYLHKQKFERGAIVKFSVGMTYAGERDSNLRDMVKVLSKGSNNVNMSSSAKNEFHIEFVELKDGRIVLQFEFNSTIYKSDRIERIAQYLRLLLTTATENPLMHLQKIDYIPQDEKKKILNQFPFGDTVDYDRNETVLNQFLKQVDSAPGNVAIEDGDKRITYKDLYFMALRFSQVLKESETSNAFVAVLLPQGIDFVISVLGIIVIGKAYVPLNINYPERQLETLLQELGNPVVVLSHEQMSGSGALLPNYENKICFELPLLNEQVFVRNRSHEGMRGNELAYCIFTSGSTGLPKGVLIEHKSLANHCSWFIKEYGLDHTERSLLLTNPCWDLCAAEIWPFLTTGSTLVVPSLDIKTNPRELRSWVHDKEISFLQTSTSLGELFYAGKPEEFGSKLKYLLTGGDRLIQYPPSNLPFKVVNSYGPTEATIDAIFYKIGSDPHGHELPLYPPIGRPIFNTVVYILDQGLNPMPIGFVGEIYIGGEGVARGYINHSVEHKFIQNPFHNECSPILYKTGDLGRWLPNGQIEFEGRIDNQIKLRGFRIELEGIERVLLQCAHVERAVVLLDKKRQRLLAFVICNDVSVHVETIKFFLMNHLPYYEIPSDISIVNSFPMTSSGKIDRTLLLSSNENAPHIIAPTGTVENIVARVWSQVLNIPIDSVHLDANFFELGGHSLNASEVTYRLSQKPWFLTLKSSNIFEFPTVRALTNYLSNGTEQTYESRGETPPYFELQQDAILNLEINLTTHPVDIHLSKTKNVFLTGATGYVGIGILYELLHRTQVQVYCLLRGTNDEIAFRRLQKNYENFCGYTLPVERVVPLAGQLDSREFGLRSSVYKNLANSIDVIIHCGADVNFIKPYKYLRSSNVEGTLHTIKFAATGQVKALHFISQLGVIEFCGEPIKEVPLYGGKGPVVGLGYDQSKWVGEKLIWQAGQAGLPVTILRLGSVGPHSQHFACLNENSATNFLKSYLSAVIQFQCFPFDDTQKHTPYGSLDFTAQSIVYLVMKGLKFTGRVFNVFEHNIHFDEILVNQHKTIVPVALDEWVQTLVNNVDVLNDGYFIYTVLMEKSYGAMSLLEFLKAPTVVYENSALLAALEGSDVVRTDIETSAQFYIKTSFRDTPTFENQSSATSQSTQ